MNFYKTAYGNVAFKLDCSNIIVRLSGGFDSAVMLYTIAFLLNENNLSPSIYPLTVRKINNPNNDPAMDKANPYPVVDTILDYVKDKFPNLDVKPTQRLDVDNWWLDNDTGKIYSNAQDELLLKIIKDYNLDTDVVSYNGVTKNPDVHIGEEKHNPEKNRQVPLIIGAIANSRSVYHNTKQFGHEIEPFRNFDKRIVFSLADRFGILQDMLSITRSCEGLREATDNFTTTCKTSPICWWCYEREWANKNYEK